jgi:hypothetical protein
MFTGLPEFGELSQLDISMAYLPQRCGFVNLIAIYKEQYDIDGLKQMKSEIDHAIKAKLLHSSVA